MTKHHVAQTSNSRKTHNLNGLLLLILIAILPFKAFAEKKLSVAIGAWPPYVDQKIIHGGLLIKLLDEAYGHSSHQQNFSNWGQAFESTVNAESDVSIGWLESKERAEKVYYSDPVIHSDNVFFHHKDLEFTWNDIDDIRPYRIGMTKGYSYGPEFDEAVEKGLIRVIISDSDQENIRRLITGEIDLFPANELVGKHILESFFSHTGHTITSDEKPISSSPLHLIVSRQHPNAEQILARFNQGLKTLKKEGKFKDIVNDMLVLISLSRMTFFTENYAPFNFLDENNELKGLAVDTLRSMFRELGIHVSIDLRSVYPWPRAYAETQKVSNSTIFAITKTKERENLFKWIGPIVRSNIVLTAHKDKNLFGLKPSKQFDKLVCVIRDDVAEQLLLSMGVDKSYLAYANSPQACAKMLSLKRVDFWAYGDVAATWYLSKEGYDLDLFEHTYLLKESSQYIALNKNVPDTVLGKLQEALNYLKLTGEAKEIMGNYQLQKLNNLQFTD